jgi:carboxyl-terminal processing protease
MQIGSLWEKVRAKRAFKLAGIGAVVVVVFGLGILTGEGRLRLMHGNGYKDQTGLPKTLDMSSINQIYDALRQNYDGKLSESQITDGLKHGLAEATGDPYTEYFTAKEAKAFNGELEGISLTGIGAQLDQDKNGNIVVMSPIDGSPAQAAGVLAKDVIISIDGQSTAGMSVGTAVGKIRGTKGTKVTLVVVRGDQQKSFTITRDTINVPTASGKILDGNVGYLQVSQFSQDTYSLLQQAVQKFQAANVKKVILDLRDNPGGEVNSAQDISSLWLPDNALIEQEKRGNDVVDSLRATGNNPLKGMPTVVLMNPGSASAAEITALALRDNKAATIIGEKSYGKGVVQAILPFNDGSELKVTVAKWYSPSGKNINHVGITPDQTVKEPAGATADNDAQLQAAEAYLASH